MQNEMKRHGQCTLDGTFIPDYDRNDFTVEIEVCLTCGGSGVHIFPPWDGEKEVICEACNGTGIIRKVVRRVCDRDMYYKYMKRSENNE
jgi:DnaJ-class molecular chaperone